MKLHFLLPLLFFVHIAHSQVKDGNKTRQIEQLQQLRQIITQRIDTLQVRLMEQANGIGEVRKKLDQLKKESAGKEKPDNTAKKQVSKLSQELANMTALANNLQKQYDFNLVALDKTINLQRDLEDKIVLLVRENNR